MSLDLSMLDDVAVAKVAAAGSAMAALAPLSQFEEDPGNPRFEDNPGEFAALVADVRERGILQPIVVRRLDNGRLRIRFGARRYRAAVQLGLTYAPYVVTDDPRQFDDYAQVAENQQRSRLQPLEMATFISKKVEQGESKRRIASRLGIDPAAVTHLLALVRDPPPFLMEMYHARRCRSPWLLYRLRLLWDVDPVLTESGCAEAGEINGALVDALDGLRAERGGAPVREASDNSELTSTRPNDAGAAPAQRLPGAAHEEPAPRGRRHNAGASTRKARLACPWPQLFGTIEGREVLVLPELLAFSEGTVIVRFLGTDTIEREVALDTIRLTRLVRS